MSTTVAKTPTSTTSAAAAAMSKRNMYIAIGAVVLVAIGIGGYLWWKSTQKPAPQVFPLPPVNPYYPGGKGGGGGGVQPPNNVIQPTPKVITNAPGVITAGGNGTNYVNPSNVPTGTVYLFDNTVIPNNSVTTSNCNGLVGTHRGLYIVPGQCPNGHAYNQASSQFSGYGYGSWIIQPVSGNIYTIQDSRSNISGGGSSAANCPSNSTFANFLCAGSSTNDGNAYLNPLTSSSPECQWIITQDPNSTAPSYTFQNVKYPSSCYLGGGDCPDGQVYTYSTTVGHPQTSIQIITSLQ